MLEVKNLTKVYSSKNGVEVRALDGITLQFPEKGMVFLLGKSGSGKSTLLNVCGGLDNPTSGEIIVKGRSSKDFTQSDFDSYRNTFVGFIFQDYNILHEFTVEDNIALALELQGKSKDKAAIDKLLEEVDLVGFGKRKPNTLSGGQKQRIAIARALVKSPEIIMADEPTGALDSTTGKQVFDTLKKLSQDKLVIIVSHDRDFAEEYADRIIELKDGKILSDVSKTSIETQAISSNVNSIGDVLCVKSGNDLTEEDFAKIKEYLKGSKKDVIIANNEKDVDNFKKVSRINDSGEKEVFANTDESKLNKPNYKAEDSRFIRSKLPLRHAIKIGLSGLKSKPFRLLLTVILCTVAFVLFGVLSTLNFYDTEETFRETLKSGNVSIVHAKKIYKATVSDYENGSLLYSHEEHRDARLDELELDQYANSFSATAIGVVKSSASFNVSQPNNGYYDCDVAGFSYLPPYNSLRDKVSGSLPQKDDELIITSYMAEALTHCRVYDNLGHLIANTVPNELIGKTITLGRDDYKIVGILDTGVIPEKFLPLQNSDSSDRNLKSDFESYMSDNMHNIAFTTKAKLVEISANSTPYQEGIINYTYLNVAFFEEGEYKYPEYWSGAHYETATSSNQTYSLNGSNTLSKGEARIPIRYFANYLSLYISEVIDQHYVYERYDAAEKLSNLRNELYEAAQGGRYEYEEGEKEPTFIPLTTEEITSTLDKAAAFVKENNVPMAFKISPYEISKETNVGQELTLNITGVVLSPEYYNVQVSSQDFDTLWNSQKDHLAHYTTIETKYTNSLRGIYDVIYMPFEYSDAYADFYWNMYADKEYLANDSKMVLDGEFINTITYVDEMVKELSKIFLIVGIVFAAFAILLFFNFISTSISQKTKEIGILRAVGARSNDVFKIFFAESLAITIICVVLSIIGCVVLCGIINAEFAADLGASLFLFGFGSFVILIALALFTCIASTLFPVYIAANKKPVDSIRAL